MKLIKRIWQSLIWALEGIKDTVREEIMIRVQFLFGLIQFVLGLCFHLSFIYILIILLLWIMLVSQEIMNTAVENAIDLVSKEKSKYAKRAKDNAAGSVVLISIFSWIIFILLVLSSYKII